MNEYERKNNEFIENILKETVKRFQLERIDQTLDVLGAYLVLVHNINIEQIVEGIKEEIKENFDCYRYS